MDNERGPQSNPTPEKIIESRELFLSRLVEQSNLAEFVLWDICFNETRNSLYVSNIHEILDAFAELLSASIEAEELESEGFMLPQQVGQLFEYILARKSGIARLVLHHPDVAYVVAQAMEVGALGDKDQPEDPDLQSAILALPQIFAQTDWKDPASINKTLLQEYLATHPRASMERADFTPDEKWQFFCQQLLTARLESEKTPYTGISMKDASKSPHTLSALNFLTWGANLIPDLKDPGLRDPENPNLALTKNIISSIQDRVSEVVREVITSDEMNKLRVQYLLSGEAAIKSYVVKLLESHQLYQAQHPSLVDATKNLVTAILVARSGGEQVHDVLIGVVERYYQALFPKTFGPEAGKPPEEGNQSTVDDLERPTQEI